MLANHDKHSTLDIVPTKIVIFERGKKGGAMCMTRNLSFDAFCGIKIATNSPPTHIGAGHNTCVALANL